MMEKPHLEFLVEEPSMEAFLHELLPRLFPEDCPSFRVHAFQGKTNMLDNLQARLKGLRSLAVELWAYRRGG